MIAGRAEASSLAFLDVRDLRIIAANGRYPPVDGLSFTLNHGETLGIVGESAFAVIAEASLSFLGVGQQLPAASWGNMLTTAKNYLEEAPWMAVWQGAAIFLTVLSFNLPGDTLQDALDPRSRPRTGI